MSEVQGRIKNDSDIFLQQLGSFFVVFGFFNLLIFFLLYNIVLVLPYINMHLPRVYTYSGLENSMDCIAYGVSKSWTQMSNFHFHFSNKEIPRIPQYV